MPKDIRRKATRTSMNAVTGELESVELTDVQQAFEKCVNYIDARMLAFGDNNAKRHRLAAMLEARMKLMQCHTDAELLEGGTSLDRAEAALKAERGGK